MSGSDGDAEHISQPLQPPTIARVSENLVRKVVKAALDGKDRLDDPRVSYKEFCLAVMEADERELLNAVEVTNMQSEFRKVLITGPTGKGVTTLEKGSEEHVGADCGFCELRGRDDWSH